MGEEDGPDYGDSLNCVIPSAAARLSIQCRSLPLAASLELTRGSGESRDYVIVEMHSQIFPISSSVKYGYSGRLKICFEAVSVTGKLPALYPRNA